MRVDLGCCFTGFPTKPERASRDVYSTRKTRSGHAVRSGHGVRARSEVPCIRSA